MTLLDFQYHISNTIICFYLGIALQVQSCWGNFLILLPLHFKPPLSAFIWGASYVSKFPGASFAASHPFQCLNGSDFFTPVPYGVGSGWVRALTYTSSSAKARQADSTTTQL